MLRKATGLGPSHESNPVTHFVTHDAMSDVSSNIPYCSSTLDPCLIQLSSLPDYSQLFIPHLCSKIICFCSFSVLLLQSSLISSSCITNCFLLSPRFRIHLDCIPILYQFYCKSNILVLAQFPSRSYSVVFVIPAAIQIFRF